MSDAQLDPSLQPGTIAPACTMALSGVDTGEPQGGIDPALLAELDSLAEGVQDKRQQLEKRRPTFNDNVDVTLDPRSLMNTLELDGDDAQPQNLDRMPTKQLMEACQKNSLDSVVRELGLSRPTSASTKKVMSKLSKEELREENEKLQQEIMLLRAELERRLQV
mmetsp:Transcript_22962/g.42218  ORF Transcript_22962/g.42218 Transcript_22962/m.42218 type:complete len:164 (+) Transcript_22962:101-592(+)